MDPNYWQTDGSINSASTFKSCLQEQKVSVAIQESDDSADVYNIVLSELANDGVTPAMLLTFPVTLKAKSGECEQLGLLAGAARRRQQEQLATTSDSREQLTS